MKPLVNVLKIVWVAAMVAALAWYLVTYWDEFSAYAARIGVPALLLSAAFLLAGKVALAATSRIALAMYGIGVSLRRAFEIYSVSQLGKYLPGSVWHLVGRVLLYRREGLPAKDGAKLLVIENLWLLGMAGALGLATCLGPLLRQAFGDAAVPSAGMLGAAAVVILMLWFLVSVAGTRLFAARLARYQIQASAVFVLQAVSWVLFGLSFWMLFPPELRDTGSLALAAGAFALGWAAGYVAIFAPAGVGVREAVIALVLAPVMPLPAALAVASLSRVVWTVTELILGTAAGQSLGGAGAIRGTTEAARP